MVTNTLVIYLEALSCGFELSVRSLLLSEQVRVHFAPFIAVGELNRLCNGNGAIVSAEWSAL